MLKDKSSSAIVAVRDIDRAREFYANVLGLDVSRESMDGVIEFRTGNTLLVVYESEEAGTNRANAVVWSCGDEIDAIVAKLEAAGVKFEHYPEMEDLRIKGNIHVSGNMKLVWLKDPDGNILHLNNI